MHIKRSKHGDRRRGAVLVLVAFGMIALLSMTALVVDVNVWNLEKAKLEQATSAAARAGYQRLKDLDFNYHNPSTRRSVDSTIRYYLRENGLTNEETFAARIRVTRKNVVTVTARRESASFFGRAAEVSSVSIKGGASLARTNDITPFAVSPRYHDCDHDQRPNVLATGGNEGFIGQVQPYKIGRPYIIKYGKPLVSLFDDMLLIPMDRREYVIPPQAFADLKIPIGIGGVNAVCSEAFYVPKQRMNLDDVYACGMFRAYGIAYQVLGCKKVDGEKPYVSWLLGFAGGSFLIKEKYLKAIGYTFKPKDELHGVIMKKGKTTNVVAVRLSLCDPAQENFVKSQAFVRYVTETLQSKKHPKVKILVLSQQPQIATLTGSADPVTRIMDYAGIPYVGINDAWEPRFNRDRRSSCKACYKITDKYPNAFKSPRIFKKFLETAWNAAGGHGFDWLHIHHEDFTEGGEYSNEKRAIVEGIRAFVREGHHHLFAACLAIETFEIFLAESVFGPKPEMLVREMLDFDNTMAFTDFDLDKSRGGAEKVGWISSIDTEKYGDKYKWFLTDYLNPRCQNHDGFGDIYLDLNKFPAELTRPSTDPARLMVAPEGSTNCVRRSVLKKYRIPEHDGLTIKSMNRPLLILGAVGSPVDGIRDWKGDSVRYLTGIIDDDRNMKNGTGEFTYLGGHRPAIEKEGTVTLVGDLYEGTYYDWPHTCIPEKLRLKKKDGSVEVLNIDWNGDGKIGGYVRMMRINRADLGFIPKSLDPTPPTTLSGWPTTGFKPHGINDANCRWTQKTGKPNYISPINSSSAVVFDFNNDGDCDDVYENCHYVLYKPDIAGHRLYLNNILYGSVAVSGQAEDASNRGAVNPGALKPGKKSGRFGGNVVIGESNNYRTMFQYGFASKTGMPVGMEFKTAPGDFIKQTDKALDFNFRNEKGEITSIPWARSNNGKRAGPGQIKIVPVVVRADDPRKSFYFGTKSHRVKIVGFARFFIINPKIDEATLTTNRESIHFLGGPPLPGEVRGYFLGWVVKPDRIYLSDIGDREP